MHWDNHVYPWKCITWSTYGALFYASIIWPHKSQPHGVVQWNIHYHELPLVIKVPVFAATLMFEDWTEISI
jgi:hypothetical protein